MKLLSIASFVCIVAASAPVHGATISNGDFALDNAVSLAGGGAFSASTLTTGAWTHRTGSTGVADWDSSGGFAIYDANGSSFDGRTRVIGQLIADGGATTGALNLQFDLSLTTFIDEDQNQFGVDVYGWDSGDTAPTLDFTAAAGNALASGSIITNAGDAVSLLSASPVVVVAGDPSAAPPTFLSPLTVDGSGNGSATLGVDTNFGSGYDNIVVMFAASIEDTNPGGTDTTEFRLDNVSFVPVPEPSSLALGLFGSLLLLGRRR